MKKTALFIACAALAFTSCKVDNYDAPDAQVFGTILDSKTGEPVCNNINQGSSIHVIEHGYENPSNQYWLIKNTGEYRNNFVFSNTYTVSFENGNFFPVEAKDYEIKKGENHIDFTVTPYLRIVDPKIVKSGNTVTATFHLEAGDPSRVNTVSEIQLFAYTDMHVSNTIHYNLSGGTDQAGLGEEVDPSKTYTLTIDVSGNKSSFKYTDKNYYFRIGAHASGEGFGEIRWNFSPLETIRF